ncbi:cmgc srpk kinase [Fusarium sporotrichioides]|uniref:Cmgc srpk kinase n=1 Tax=Fusarium sporotrichioides TaxID=5514 RepID=A0A395RYY0_FUSSP|nr:cmgc srpk kinase [Fusarium sporotrichioides]
MNGTQSPDAQKALNANSNGSNSNNSSLAAKKRKKDLKPIITMEGANQTDGYSSTLCRWPFARATTSPTGFGMHWYLLIVHPHRIRDFATDMKLGSRLAYFSSRKWQS